MVSPARIRIRASRAEIAYSDRNPGSLYSGGVRNYARVVASNDVRGRGPIVHEVGGEPFFYLLAPERPDSTGTGRAPAAVSPRPLAASASSRPSSIRRKPRVGREASRGRLANSSSIKGIPSTTPGVGWEPFAAGSARMSCSAAGEQFLASPSLSESVCGMASRHPLPCPARDTCSGRATLPALRRRARGV